MVDEGGWGGFPQRGSGQRLESKPTSKGGDSAGGTERVQVHPGCVEEEDE